MHTLDRATASFCRSLLGQQQLLSLFPEQVGSVGLVLLHTCCNACTSPGPCKGLQQHNLWQTASVPPPLGSGAQCAHLKLSPQHGLSQGCLQLPLNGALDWACTIHWVIPHSSKVPAEEQTAAAVLSNKQGGNGG